MGLREQAHLDLQGILEDESGFSWPIVVVNPFGDRTPIKGFSTDIGLTIDPNTGVPVAGQRASVALPIARLTAAGLALPKNIAERNKKPWLVEFADVLGRPRVYRVVNTIPDVALGCVVLIVEDFKQ